MKTKNAIKKKKHKATKKKQTNKQTHYLIRHTYKYAHKLRQKCKITIIKNVLIKRDCGTRWTYGWPAGLQIEESGFEDWCRVLGQDIGTLSKPRRQRQRERVKIKGLKEHYHDNAHARTQLASIKENNRTLTLTRQNFPAAGAGRASIRTVYITARYIFVRVLPSEIRNKRHAISTRGRRRRG